MFDEFFWGIFSSDFQFINDASNLPFRCHVVDWGLVENIWVIIKKKSCALLIEIPEAKHTLRCLSHPSANFGSISLKIFTSSGLFYSIAKLSASRSFLGHSHNLNCLSLTKSKAGLDSRAISPYRLFSWGFHTAFASQEWTLDMSHHRCRREQGMVQ